MNECRECRAGYAQAKQFEPGWACPTHGVVGLSDFDACRCDYDVSYWSIGCPIHGQVARELDQANAELGQLRVLVRGQAQLIEGYESRERNRAAAASDDYEKGRYAEHA